MTDTRENRCTAAHYDGFAPLCRCRGVPYRSRNRACGSGQRAQGLLEYGLALGLIALVTVSVLLAVGKYTSRSVCGVTQGFDNSTICGNLLSTDTGALERGLGGWVANGSNVAAQTTAQAFDGTHSLALTATAAGVLSASTVGPVLVPGQTYMVRAQFRAATSPRPSNLQIDWVNGKVALSAPPVTDATTGWTALSMAVSVPSDQGATPVTVEVQVSGAIAAEVQYVDHISVVASASSNLLAADVAAPGRTMQWTVDGALAPVLTTDQAWTGTQSILATSVSIPYTGIMFVLTLPLAQVTAGQQVTYGAELRALTTASAFYVFGRWYNTVGAAIGQSFDVFSGPATDSVSAWTANSVTTVVPPGAALMRLYVQINSAIGQSHYVGGAFVRSGTSTVWEPGYAP